MKRSTKITAVIITFFVIIAVIIAGRYMVKLHFQKKFSVRQPPAVIVAIVENKNFHQKIETYGTALSSKTTLFRIKKSELLEPINFNRKVKKGDIIAKLKTESIAAPFSGILGKIGISESTLGSENSIIVTLDDTSTIFSDLKIPEIYAGILKKGLPIEAKFASYKNKTYKGEIESVASRIDAQTRSILTRVKINNENSELIPGALVEIQIKYNERNALSIPDTSIMNQGAKKFVYKVLENSTVNKLEVNTGTRYEGNIEVLSGLNIGDKVVAEGLMKVRPGAKIKPIIK
jgi:membrane fusion protein (multidrug efflux system)